jgi:hypothetical protein
MTKTNYSPEELEKMKKIPGTFMWIKEKENKVQQYEKEILSSSKNRRK